MKASLTIFLLRKSFATIAAAKEACTLDGYVPVDPTSEMLVDIAVCFAKSSPAAPPRWVNFYREGFGVPPELLRTRSSSLIVFVVASKRIFAITAGHGHHAIPRSIVESDFGLRATLNAIGPATLRSLQSRTVDPLTVQRLEVSNRKTSLQSFVLDQERELLAKLEGVPERQTDGLTMAGSNSVHLNCEAHCDDLPAICSRLLTLSRQKRYRASFGFIDRMRPVQADEEIAALDSKLVSFIVNRGNGVDSVSLAIPSIQSYGEVERYRAKQGNHVLGDLADLDINKLFDIVDDLPEDDRLLESVRVIAEDTDGKVVEGGILRDWVVAETQWKKSKYVLTAGSWYCVASDYIDEVNELVAGLSVINKRGYLPSMYVWDDEIEPEGDYNARCVSANCLCLDKNTIQMERSGKIEVCDLLTRSRHLIHVKKQVSSGTLSHLWAQGVVSAQLLAEDRVFRSKVRRKLGDFSELVPLDGFDPGQFVVVYAIATGSSGFPRSLPFFSKVNLLHHSKGLRRLGYNVKLRKIDYERKCR